MRDNLALLRSSQIRELFLKAKSTNGCIETAVAALGGNFDIISDISTRKIEGSIEMSRPDHRIIEESGLQVKYGFKITSDLRGVSMAIGEGLTKKDISGALIISTRPNNLGHAVAIIGDENGDLLKLDTAADQWLSPVKITEIISQVGDDKPDVVLMLGKKKR